MQPGGKQRRNRKSKKDRSKHPHGKLKCVRPDCFSCSQDNVFNLTGKPLSREQTLLLSKRLSFIPRTAEVSARELMIDLGKFIQKVKIKCGKLTVKAHRQMTGRKGTKHVPGTPQINQHQWYKQIGHPTG